MSGCRNGGRDVYERPDVREYDQRTPIRGHIVYGDGTQSSFTFARFFNGKERAVRHVVIDGVRYVARPERDWDAAEGDWA